LMIRTKRPRHAEIMLDTVNCAAEENAHRILDHLVERGFIRSPVVAGEETRLDRQEASLGFRAG